ncbi:MAG: tyrosine-type recombinase/integrase [Coriobacteriales bacterium]
MDKTFKKEFIANGLAAHVMRRKKYKNAVSYIIRYRRNGYDIFVCAATIESAKQAFIVATKPENIEKYHRKTIAVKTDKNTFKSIASEWLKTKEGKVDPRTLRDYQMNCETRIFPIIGERPIATIRTNDITEIINTAKGRVIETLQTIFKGIMKYSMANGDITFNPMQAVTFQKVARKKRRALTKKEEKTFFERIELPEFKHYKPFFLLQYYFGLRPWELRETRFDGDFLIALNAKHEEDGEVVYKKIPIPKQLKARLDTTKNIICNHRTDVLNRIFKRIMQDEEVTQYFLRHTFSSTCKQFVAKSEIVDLWMGDSPEKLVDRVYTHFPDEFMREQMDLVKFFA